jgi:Rho GTPase-activating protein 1
LHSPKFAKKLHNVQTLSQLASLVPFRQLSIPDQVYEYNLTLEPSVTIPSPPTNLPKDDRVFGRPLQDLMSEIDETRLAIPPIIDHCFGFIRQYGMKTEGIFRRSPSSVELKYVKAEFNRGQLPDFNRYSSPVHLAAVTIKMFLRELPWPLLPSECYPSLQEHYGLDKGACNTEQKANYFVDEFLPLMSGVPCERILLLYMLRFFGEELCINHEHTKMTPTNIGIVFGPNLVRCGDDIVKELELSRCASQFIKDAVESWALIKTHSIR